MPSRYLNWFTFRAQHFLTTFVMKQETDIDLTKLVGMLNFILLQRKMTLLTVEEKIFVSAKPEKYLLLDIYNSTI